MRKSLVESMIVFIAMVLITSLLLTLPLLLSSCGNRAILDPGNFHFRHVHASNYLEGHCWDIDKWWDNDSGIEVRTLDGDGLFLSEGTYQLFESKEMCPYCGE